MSDSMGRVSECKISNQRGIALAVSMILLFIITMLSVSAMRSTNIDTKITVNHQFKQMSFQAAESALARLLGEDPNITVPVATEGTFTLNPGYFTSTAVTHQPDMSADVTLTFLKVADGGLMSGDDVSSEYLIYQADAVGSVTGSNATAHNRMKVARIKSQE